MPRYVLYFEGAPAKLPAGAKVIREMAGVKVVTEWPQALLVEVEGSGHTFLQRMRTMDGWLTSHLVKFDLLEP